MSVHTPLLGTELTPWPEKAIPYPITPPDCWLESFNRNAAPPTFSLFLPQTAVLKELDKRFRRFPDEHYAMLASASPKELQHLPDNMRLGVIRLGMMLYLRDSAFIHCFLDNMFNMFRYLIELGSDWARFLEIDHYSVFGTDFAFPEEHSPWADVVATPDIGRKLGLNFTHFFRLMVANRLESDVEILLNPPALPSDCYSGVVNESAATCLPLSARSVLRVHFTPDVCIRILPQHLSSGSKIVLAEQHSAV